MQQRFTTLATLLPFGLLNRLWYYSVFLLSELVGIYFLVVGVWHWVKPSSEPLTG